MVSARREAAQQGRQAAVIHLEDEGQHSQQVQPHCAAMLASAQRALGRTGCALLGSLQLL